jgi:hypothetical protein
LARIAFNGRGRLPFGDDTGFDAMDLIRRA